MHNGLPLTRLFAASFAVIFALSCASTTVAQSGRHPRKSTPAPAATPQPTPTASKPAEKEKAVLTFIIGVDRYRGFSTIPLSYYDTVTRGCAERLDDATAVKVDIVHGELSRSDAVTRAKAEKEAYVVWLQIKVENVRADPTIVDNVSQLYIEYAVFAPTTARNVAFGHTYQQGYRKGGVVVGPPSSGQGSVGYSEYLLKQAAREAAERILGALKIQTVPPLPSAISSQR
jgi:hypothetical protein